MSMFEPLGTFMLFGASLSNSFCFSHGIMAKRMLCISRFSNSFILFTFCIKGANQSSNVFSKFDSLKSTKSVLLFALTKFTLFCKLITFLFHVKSSKPSSFIRLRSKPLKSILPMLLVGFEESCKFKNQLCSRMSSFFVCLL